MLISHDFSFKKIENKILVYPLNSLDMSKQLYGEKKPIF